MIIQGILFAVPVFYINFFLIFSYYSQNYSQPSTMNLCESATRNTISYLQNAKHTIYYLNLTFIIQESFSHMCCHGCKQYFIVGLKL